MAKKTRRPNIPEQTLERARRQVAQVPAAPVAPAADAAADSPAPAPKRHTLTSADLSAEYAYVVSDLQNMGILASAFLAVLFALSFIL